jgi:large subunit ribosomal protein L4
MIEIPVHNSKGEQVDTLQLDEQLLGGEVRPYLLKQAYVRFHGNRRLGTSATKNRSRVEGSTRKLYKQKGTGNARRGPIRTNIMRGGGVAFAKRPKSWRTDMPKKMRRLANRNAVLAKAVDHEIKLVDQLKYDKPSTKDFASLLASLKIDRSCLVALANTTGAEATSARNIDGVSITRVDQLNAFDLLNHRYLLADRDGFLAWIEQAQNHRNKPAPVSSVAGEQEAD